MLGLKISALPFTGLYGLGWIASPLWVSLTWVRLRNTDSDCWAIRSWWCLRVTAGLCCKEDGLISSPGSWHLRGWGQFGVVVHWEVMVTKCRNAAFLRVRLFLGLTFSFLSSYPARVPVSLHLPSLPLSIHLSPQQLLGLGTQWAGNATDLDLRHLAFCVVLNKCACFFGLSSSGVVKKKKKKINLKTFTEYPFIPRLFFF